MATTTPLRRCLGTSLAAACLAFSPVLAVRVSVPDLLNLANAGDTLTVPIHIINQGGQGIVAVDLAVEFSSDTLRGTRRYLYGNAAPQDSNWNVMTNFFPCSLLVAMASTTPLIRVAQADTWDTLLYVKMVSEVGSTSARWPIRFLRCRLNEGQVACTTEFVTGMEGEHWNQRSAEQAAVSPNPGAEAVWLRGQKPAELVAAGGQRVLALMPGRNDVSRLPRGLYFVRPASGVERHASSVERMSKVVLVD